jgi:hypothetical protein
LNEQAIPTVVEVEVMSFPQFAGSGLVVHVESEVVGEAVLFAADAYRAVPGDPIAYGARELAVLCGAAPELIRLVHAVKRTFPGARCVASKEG